jgi:hypothetical protein
MARGGFVQDPEEDCYMVTREEGAFLVRHFPNRTTKKPCCKVRVKVTDADRAHAIPDADPHGECYALARTMKAIERKHAGILDKNPAGV